MSDQYKHGQGSIQVNSNGWIVPPTPLPGANIPGSEAEKAQKAAIAAYEADRLKREQQAREQQERQNRSRGSSYGCPV